MLALAGPVVASTSACSGAAALAALAFRSALGAALGGGGGRPVCFGKLAFTVALALDDDDGALEALGTGTLKIPEGNPCC